MIPQFLGWPTTVSSVIADALNKVFEVLTTPLFTILKAILVILVKILYSLFSQLLRNWLYTLLGIVDFFQGIFDIFAGVDTVKYEGEEMYLLDAFMTHDTVKNAFVMVTFIGVVLCFIFTIYTVGKSIGTHILENKNPVGHIMGQALKACITFMIVPIMAYFGLQLSTAILVSTDRAINNSMGSDDTVPISTVLFLSGTLDGETDADFSTGVRADYLSGRRSIYNDPQVCADFEMTQLDDSVFDALTNSNNNTTPEHYLLNGNSYNYFLVYGEALFVIIVMLCAVFLFVRRIIEVLILYITAPLFVSTIPMDDGHIFKRWRELFIGKLISGFGVIFTMKLVMMLIPVVIGGNFHFTGNSMIDGVIKTVFALGSIFAAYKSQHTLLEAFNPEIAMAARESTGVLIMLSKQAASIGMAVATGGTSAAASSAGAAAGAAGSAAGTAGAASGSAAFTGGAGTAGGLSTGAGGTAGGAASAGSTSGAVAAPSGGSAAGTGSSAPNSGAASSGPAKSSAGSDTGTKPQGGQAFNDNGKNHSGISAKDIADSINSSGDEKESKNDNQIKG